MELRDIEIFLTLAEELHFGRTAERLHVSVSRVSQAIRSQETEIDAPLFIRSSRRVELTPVGAALRVGLEPAYEGIRRSIADVVAMARLSAETLTIGVQGAQAHELEPVLTSFRAAHPLADVRFREVYFTDPFSALRRGEVDVVTAWLPVEEADLVVACVLREEPLNLMMSARHPLAGLPEVPLEALGDLVIPDVVGPAPAQWLAAVLPQTTPSGRPIRREHSVSTFQEVLAVVASGEAVSPVPDEGRRYYPRPGIAYVPFADAEPVRWALIRRREPLTPLVSSFVSFARRGS
ncbi:LysR family transcriptional regulator [Rathayibacter sp. YIM 133350]|uniref:LysR family transcriptional regulator n=1 Tax=Rathayibacter sp. YIM 133350 TaxID=3131992 RepID=UPI00307CD810